MSEVVTIGGQSMINVQLQGAGTLQGLFETLRANDLTLADPEPETKVQVVANNASLALAMKQSGAKIANKEAALDDGWDALRAIRKDEGAELLSLSCLLNTLKN